MRHDKYRIMLKVKLSYIFILFYYIELKIQITHFSCGSMRVHQLFHVAVRDQRSHAVTDPSDIQLFI